MIIGQGAFGKVYLGELKEDKSLYAVKALKKHEVIKQGMEELVDQELDLMLNLTHPFLIDLFYVFQSKSKLYFVQEFIPGGELEKLLSKEKYFSEDTIIFYTAQIVMAIGYMHSNNYIHRDLKLENVLIDADGYLKIIDFGISRKVKKNEDAKTYAGTADYMAPEMINRSGYDKSIDWWAVGIMMYEMLIGCNPFKIGKVKIGGDMYFNRVKNQKVIFPDPKQYKIKYSPEMKDLIEKLLDKNRTTRIGSNGDALEILNHKLFKNLDRNDLFQKKINPPLKPAITDIRLKFEETKKEQAQKETYIKFVDKKIASKTPFKKFKQI